MRRHAASLFSLLLAVSSFLPATAEPTAERRPSLVLFIAVDQFRYDYLTRFRAEYNAGLDKLLRNGAVFTNAYLIHYPSVTAVGHSTMLTGATPSISGIVGNDWYDRESRQSVTSVSDEKTQLLGGNGGAGESPNRLLVTTVGDQLKMVANSKTKVIGMSLKDRSAILPAGHAADGAFWLDSHAGNFVSSTFYFPDLPQWVKDFNAERLIDKYADTTWEPLAPAGGGKAPAFSVKTPGPGTSLYSKLPDTPYGNELLELLAQRAITAEQLGQRPDATDILTVSFSSNDYIGHEFGPDSPQVRDISVRTDRVLGTLLAFVDQKVGLSRVLVVLTADHGVAQVPEVLTAKRVPAGRMTGADLFGPMEKAIVAKFGAGKWILNTAGTSPYLNYDLMREKGVDPADVRRVAAEATAGVPHVLRVYTRDQLLKGEVPNDPWSQQVLRSYNQKRSGDLEVLLDPNWMRSGTGTTHGTPYAYDTHIPLIFMGPGIRSGSYHGHVALNDAAPTLAVLLSVEPPNGSVGRVLVEMLEK